MKKYILILILFMGCDFDPMAGANKAIDRANANFIAIARDIHKNEKRIKLFEAKVDSLEKRIKALEED